jgi:aromatic-amino-acid transaminase
VKGRTAQSAQIILGNLIQLARTMWSMPPDHGAAAVRIVLDTPELRDRWPGELAAMRDRINSVRKRIAGADPRLAYIGGQFGMFSMLPISKNQVLKLRKDHAIYMADSGRFNVVGLSDDQVDRFTAAVVEALDA